MNPKRLKPLKSKNNRQQIDDLSDINPNTGLPKHIYRYGDNGVRGIFQMKGKRHYTPLAKFGAGEAFATQEDAVEHCKTLLDQLKQEKGWRGYVENREWRENATTNGIIMPNKDV